FGLSRSILCWRSSWNNQCWRPECSPPWNSLRWLGVEHRSRHSSIHRLQRTGEGNYHDSRSRIVLSTTPRTPDNRGTVTRLLLSHPWHNSRTGSNLGRRARTELSEPRIPCNPCCAQNHLSTM